MRKKKQKRNPRLLFRLKEARKARGLTLAQLAEKTGLSIATLGDLETGKSAMPSDNTLIVLHDTLGVGIPDLIQVTP